MIHLYHVTKIHASGTEVLQNAFFSASPGSWTLVTGEGRVGKSTFLKILSGEDKPTWGRVVVAGRDPSSLEPADRSRWLSRVGLIFPDLGLLPGRTVEENLLLPLLLMGGDAAALKKRMGQVLEAAGLSGKAKYLPSELSQSEQRLTAALRAILPRPDLLLADEPTLGLSPRSAESLTSLLSELNKDGTTIVTAMADAKPFQDLPGVERVTLSGGKLIPTAGKAGVKP